MLTTIIKNSEIIFKNPCLKLVNASFAVYVVSVHKYPLKVILQ